MLAKIKIKDRWEYGRKNVKGKVFASERVNREEVREEYERKIYEKLREARMNVLVRLYIFIVFKGVK